jgi:hypothetical protein
VLFKPMRATIERFALPVLLADLEIKVDAWGDDAWARGAASLVLHHLYQSPMHQSVRYPVMTGL